MKQFGFVVLLLLNRYSQSLLCYDCYDTGPSNEKCVKSKNCTGEACLLYEGEDLLLTTAFCLLNLPNHYRKRNKINDAKCWMERNGKGKHCICSQNFCNQLRDRRIPLQGNTPLINASMTSHNPLIDYDYTNENESHFTFDLMHLENHANVIGNEPSSKDLIPIEIENPDYKDVLESTVQRPIKSTSSLSSSSSSSPINNEYHQLLTTNYTTKHVLNHNSHFYAANEEMKRKQPPHISIMNAIHPDQMLQEIKENITLPKIASNNFKMSFKYFKIMLFLKLFHTFHA
ncbi:hypothetical protein ACH3XW_42270 [Acanthocheilonema viteae]|uniref:Activin types I and II receptor domain-containing protein n=1 Tax=Acanthocheilonema viteae TaxID=6277 RepID=A0A498SJU2_ACAVI|nr:unnamed protein product [Acanthocheilonema viteae]